LRVGSLLRVSLGALGAGELGAGALGGELGALGSGLSGFKSCALTTETDAKRNVPSAMARTPTPIASNFIFMIFSSSERKGRLTGRV
jgi:hypothetical protein